MTKYISITSADKVVGKTTVAINLATALTGLGKSVILVDSNHTNPSISFNLGINSYWPTLKEVLKGEKSVKEITYVHKSGLKVIPSSKNFHNMENFNDQFNKVMLELFGKSEYVIMDTNYLTFDTSFDRFNSGDEMLFVANPNNNSLKNSLKMIKYAEKNDLNVLGIILNDINREHTISPEEIQSFLGRQILSVIPEDYNIKKALAMRHPLVYTYPKSQASIEFKKLAHLLVL